MTESRSLVLCGVSATLTTRALYLLLAVGSLLCAVGFSTLQERLYRTPGFKFGGFLTFVTYAVYCVLARVEQSLTHDKLRRGSLKAYALVSVLAVAGYYTTNWALLYLNYATRVVFKSCKVLPVMAVGAAVHGRRYSAKHYGSALALVVGVALFTLGDKESSPRFNAAGVLLIGIALVCDALTSNYEEKWFFRTEDPCTHAEVMLWLSGFAAALSFAVILVTGELKAGVGFMRGAPEITWIMVASSASAYLSVSFILLLIKHFDATHAEMVKALRRILQVSLSFMLYPRPVGWKTIVGGVLVFTALYAFSALQRRKEDKDGGEVVVLDDLEEAAPLKGSLLKLPAGKGSPP